MRVLDQAPAVPPNVTAGLFLCARELAAHYGLEQPSVGRVLSATGAGRSRAYELKQQLLSLLPGLAAPPGRPRAERPVQSSSHAHELRGEMLRFVMKHPGVVHAHGQRGRYSEPLRVFVLALRDRYESLSLADFAEALCLPLGTVEDWLRAPTPEAHTPDERGAKNEHEPTSAQLQTVLIAWRAWNGDFGAFCEHVRRDHRLELGNTMISSILFAHGERTPVRRGGRSSRDESALRGAFQTFFPGAQWVADGKTLEVVIDGEVLHVNLELIVDAATDAAVGISVRDEEDGKAVVEAFQSGVETTAEPPLALLLDNRPSNHTPEVDDALGETMRMRATPERPQNKAHVEGTFGLFAQKTPPIEVDTHDPRVLARQLALLVATVFFRALNRAPRRDRNGHTRIELYGEHVSPEQRDAAKKALRERLRKQELARQTRAVRLDPLVRAILDDAFERLGLVDPERHLRDAIACYPLDAIVDAIARYSAMRERGALKPSMDGRYLLGIVRNLHHQHEADPTSIALMRERLAARDRLLLALVHERDALLAARDACTAVDDLLERLLAADRCIDRHFWIDAIVEALAELDEHDRRALMLRAARRIHAAFRLTPRERNILESMLLRRLWPLG